MDAFLHEGRVLVSGWPETATPLPSPQQSEEILPAPIIRLPPPEPLILVSSTSQSPNFLDYTTQDRDAEMPSPSSSPSSDTSELSIDSSASSLDSPIPQPIGPPALSFEIAAADAAIGIQYAMETYPTETSYIAEQYKKDGVYVEAGDRVELLEELPNFAVKIKVVKNGAVGLLPAWNMEDPFERLARLNMEFNEAATCPREEEAKSGFESSSQQKCTLAHVHARCPTQTSQTRRQFVSGMRKLDQENASSSGSDSDSDLTTPELEHRAQTFKLSAVTRRSKPKTVNFQDQSRKVVYRYYLPAHLNKKEEKKRRRWDSDSDSEDLPTPPAEPEEDNSQWWWQGWTEDPDAAEVVTVPSGPVPRVVLTPAGNLTPAPAPVVSLPTVTARLPVAAAIPPSSPIPPLSKPRSPSPETTDSEIRRGSHHLIRGRIRRYALRVFQ